MSTNVLNRTRAYGIGEDLITLKPRPIIAKRNPRETDKAPVSTVWINETTGASYILVNDENKTYTWGLTSSGRVLNVGTTTTDTIANAKLFNVVFTVTSLGAGFDETFTIDNNELTGLASPLLLTVTTTGDIPEDISINYTEQKEGKLVVEISNDHATDDFNGEVVVSGEILN